MSNEGEELRKRFDRLKREQGISRAAFAKTHQIKGGDAMIYQHINGMKPISLEAGIAYAAAFGCSLKDISPRLAEHAQTISEKLEPNISTGLTLYPDKRGIPIISWVQAGTWRQIVDSFPRGGADDYILAHNSHGRIPSRCGSSEIRWNLNSESMTSWSLILMSCRIRVITW